MSNLYHIKKLFNNIHLHHFSNYIIKNPINYQKKIIMKNNKFELVMISWEKFAETNFHNHPKNGCVMKILEGRLLEYTPEETKLLCKNDINIKYHNHYHSIKSLDKTYSIHYYSPPGFYD